MCTYLATVEQPHFRNVVVLAVFRVVMFSVVFRIQIRTPPTPIMQYFVRGILHHAFKHWKKKHIETNSEITNHQKMKKKIARINTTALVLRSFVECDRLHNTQYQRLP